MSTGDSELGPSDNSEPGVLDRPGLEAVRSARSRIAASPAFARSRRLIRLLEFTIDVTLAGRSGEIKESTIGCEVYDRGPDFDARADGIVRVEASRLRQKLAEYYEGPGQGDPVRIDYPKGSYVPTFRFVEAATISLPPAAAGQPLEIARSGYWRLAATRRNKLLLAGISVLFCIGVATVLYEIRARSHALFMRPGAAVLTPVNLSGNPADVWLSAALRDLIGAEISADGRLRIPPGELVSRAEQTLPVRPSAGLAPDTFSDISRTLNVETVLTGSYVVAGEPGNRQVRVDLRIQGARDAEPDAGISETGSPERLLELTSRLGIRLRQRLQIRELPGFAVHNSEAASPSAPLYYSGIQRMNAYDPLGALVYLDQAVRADPHQPMSHLGRAECLELLGRDPEAREAIARAYDLRAALSRDQQLRIEAKYFRLKPAPASAADVLRALITFYPDEIGYRFQRVEALNEAGRYRESIAEIAAMRALPAPLNRDPRIDWADMVTAHKQTDFPRRLASAQALEARARGLHADWLLAEALTREVAPLARAKQIPQAWAALKTAREICERLNDRACVAFSWRNEGTMLVGLGEAPKALEAFDMELNIGRQIGSVIETGNALNGIGVVRQILGDMTGARDALQEALDITVRNQDQFGIKMETINLAGVLMNLGDVAGAGRLYESSLNLSRKTGESEGEALSLVGMGQVLSLGGKHDQAVARFEEAETVARRASNLQTLAGAAIALANADLATRRLDIARPATLEAIRVADKSGDTDNQIESRLSGARLAMEEQRFAAAESALRAIKPLIAKNESADQTARMATLAVELALAQNRDGGAELEQLRNIPAGTPMATALEARVVLGRATRRNDTVKTAVNEAHRLGLLLVEQSAEAGVEQRDTRMPVGANPRSP